MREITIICTPVTDEQLAMAVGFGVMFDSDQIPYTEDLWGKGVDSSIWYLVPGVTDAFFTASEEFNEGLYPDMLLNKGMTEDQIDLMRTFMVIDTVNTPMIALSLNGVVMNSGFDK